MRNALIIGGLALVAYFLLKKKQGSSSQGAGSSKGSGHAAASGAGSSSSAATVVQTGAALGGALIKALSGNQTSTGNAEVDGMSGDAWGDSSNGSQSFIDPGGTPDAQVTGLTTDGVVDPYSGGDSAQATDPFGLGSLSLDTSASADAGA